MSELARTETAVHDAQSAARQRARETGMENALLLSAAAGAQLLAFGALYLLPEALNAAWWAALLAALPACGLFALGLLVRRTLPEGSPRPVHRALFGLIALLFLSDMAVDLLALTELTQTFILPGASRPLLALAAAGAVSLAAPHRGQAAPHAARLLRRFFFLAFLFCMATVLPDGEPGYLYPVAGNGALPALRAAAKLSGAVWAAGALPLTLPRGAEAEKRALVPTLQAVGLAGLLLLACAYVLPATALGAELGFAMRLQTLMEMSPNTLSWSLMLLAEMLLFLMAAAAGGAFLTRCAGRAAGRKSVPLLPFLLACVPLAALGARDGAAPLLALAPYRAPALALGLGAGLIANLIYKRKKKA